MLPGEELAWGWLLVYHALMPPVAAGCEQADAKDGGDGEQDGPREAQLGQGEAVAARAGRAPAILLEWRAIVVARQLLVGEARLER